MTRVTNHASNLTAADVFTNELDAAALLLFNVNASIFQEQIWTRSSCGTTLNAIH